MILNVIQTFIFIEGAYIWPHDFKFVTSEDAKESYEDFACQTIRPANVLQNAKSFCYRKRKDADPGLVITSKNFDKSFQCVKLAESGDLAYDTKYLCMDKETYAALKPKWNFLFFTGFKFHRCLGFNLGSVVNDVWANNYLCGADTMLIGTRKCTLYI